MLFIGNPLSEVSYATPVSECTACARARDTISTFELAPGLEIELHIILQSDGTMHGLSMPGEEACRKNDRQDLFCEMHRSQTKSCEGRDLRQHATTVNRSSLDCRAGGHVKAG